MCPPYQFGLGWGIEFEEGWCMDSVIRWIATIFVAAATVFLVCWWRMRHDVQGASGIAAVLVSYATLIITMFTAVAVTG